jgi:hypothetical protein
MHYTILWSRGLQNLLPLRYTAEQFEKLFLTRISSYAAIVFLGRLAISFSSIRYLKIPFYTDSRNQELTILT